MERMRIIQKVRKAVAVIMLLSCSYLLGVGVGYLLIIAFCRSSSGAPLVSMPDSDALPEALILSSCHRIDPSSSWGIFMLRLGHPLSWLIEAVIMFMGVLVMPKEIRCGTMFTIRGIARNS